MSRLEFTRATKDAAWLRSDFACEGILSDGTRCNTNLRQKSKEFDHDIACWFKGANDLSNCRVLCIPCHRAKTCKDAGLIAKSKRVYYKYNGIKKPSRLKSRGFRKAEPQRTASRPLRRGSEIGN